MTRNHFYTGLPSCRWWLSIVIKCVCVHHSKYSSSVSLTSFLGRAKYTSTLSTHCDLVSLLKVTWKYLIEIPSYHDVSHFSDTYYLAMCLGSTQMALASSLAVMVWVVHYTPRSTFFYLSSERILKSSPSSLPQNHFHSLKRKKRKKAPIPNFCKFHRFQ